MTKPQAITRKRNCLRLSLHIAAQQNAYAERQLRYNKV